MSSVPALSDSAHYFGGRFGAVANDDHDVRVGVFEEPGLFNATGSAFFGFRRQMGELTLGAEVESSLLPSLGNSACGPTSGSCGLDVARFGSVRAVIGLDHPIAHISAHAGVAVADVRASQDGGLGDVGDYLAGWMAGVGIHRNLGDSNWFVSGDVSFYSFGETSIKVSPGVAASAQPEFVAARFGLGLSF